jgi:hypothetical protein
LDKEHRVSVELQCERRKNVGCILGTIQKLDFERAFEAKEVVQQSNVGSVVGVLFIVGSFGKQE